MRYAMLCILVLCLSSVLCVEGKADVLAAKYDNEIKIAIDALESHWRKLYKEVSDLDSGEASPDGYFEIKNTRIVVLKNNSSEKLGRPCMRYQVEFVIATDYFCASPYYFVLPLDNIVVILDDGKVEVVQKNVLYEYRSFTYSNEFTEFIEEIHDVHGKYNIQKNLKWK